MTRDIPLHHYDYEVVEGWFVQDDGRSDGQKIPEGFGLRDPSPERWSELKAFIHRVNIENRIPGTIHKVFFLGRHGEGYHNVAEYTYGTEEWERYWARLNGNGQIVWGPDPQLTETGIQQAEAANRMWMEQTKIGIPTPDVIYTSPFRRAIDTMVITFKGWFNPEDDGTRSDASKTVAKIVLEDLHETTGVHTCDMRRPKSVIQEQYPFLLFENGFAENDPTWTPDHRETFAEQDVRSKKALDKMIMADGTFISVSAHSGTISSIFRVVGHKVWALSPGEVVPVVIKATQRS